MRHRSTLLCLAAIVAVSAACTSIAAAAEPHPVPVQAEPIALRVVRPEATLPAFAAVPVLITSAQLHILADAAGLRGADSLNTGQALARAIPTTSTRDSTMPHDRNGNLVKSGDTVIIEATVSTVYAAEDFCNATVIATAPMPGASSPTTITLNTRQLEVTKSYVHEEPAAEDTSGVADASATATADASAGVDQASPEPAIADDPGSPDATAAPEADAPLANPEE